MDLEVMLLSAVGTVDPLLREMDQLCSHAAGLSHGSLGMAELISHE